MAKSLLLRDRRIRWFAFCIILKRSRNYDQGVKLPRLEPRAMHSRPDSKMRADKPRCHKNGNSKVKLQLSAQAEENLEKLRLKSLNQRGEMPNVSELIERLINKALKNERELPYPGSKHL